MIEFVVASLGILLLVLVTALILLIVVTVAAFVVFVITSLQEEEYDFPVASNINIKTFLKQDKK